MGEAKNETNVGIDDKISDKLSGKIVVNVNSTINDTSNQTLFAIINGTVNDIINGTVTGNINGTIYDATNGTVIGTLNGPVNGTIESTVNKTQTFEWLLLIPLFAASLLFLCWISRFFDKMNFCLVGLVLLAFLFWAFSFDFVSNEIRPILMGLILVLIFIVVIHEIFLKDKNEDKGNPIMNLKDIIRNLTTIFIVIIWPLILYHFYKNGIEEIKFYGTEKTNFPVYIIAASYIGVLSYLFLSIEESFGHLMPEYKKISIAWAYLRRIFIAPFIAIIGFYVLNALQNRDEFSDINDYFVFVFSFFAGVFTKTIEEWIYAWVQKLLPDAKQQEFNARTQYEVKETDFVKILGCDEDLAYMLYNAKIRTIEELATFEGNEAELMKKVNLDTRNIGEGTGCLLKSRPDTLGSYTQKQLQLYICRAKCFTEMCKKSDLSKKLHMDRHLAFKLCALAGITTFDDLINCDPEQVHKKACYYIDYPQETHDKLCDCQEKEITKFIEEAKKKKEKEIELKPQKDGTTERDLQKELETQVWIKFWEFLPK